MAGSWVYDEPSLRDFISLVLFLAPDEFPREDYLSDDEQLTLDLAFDELRHGLQFVKTLQGDSPKTERARALIEEAYGRYQERQLATPG